MQLDALEPAGARASAARSWARAAAATRTIGPARVPPCHRAFGPVPLVDLDELPDDALIMPCGDIGAPVVSIEKLGAGDEGGWLRDGLERVRGGRSPR